MANTTDKQYRLTDDFTCPVYILKVGRNKRLTILDDSNKDRAKWRNRAIRHCPNESSIFMDEQSEHAVVEPIIIEGGYKTVKADDITTMKFLDNHPDNVSNGGAIFELVDDEKEAGFEISREELVSDLIQTVKDKEKEKEGIYDLLSVVAVLKGNVAEATAMSSSELKRTLYGYIQSDPELFVDEAGNITIFADEQIKRKYIVLRAINEGVLVVAADKRSVMWGSNKSVIVAVPRAINPVDFFADFLESDEGMLVLNEISSRF